MLVFDPTFGEIYWTVPRFLVKHVMSYESVGAKEIFFGTWGARRFFHRLASSSQDLRAGWGDFGELKLQTKIPVAKEAHLNFWLKLLKLLK